MILGHFVVCVCVVYIIKINNSIVPALLIFCWAQKQSFGCSNLDSAANHRYHKYKNNLQYTYYYLRP